MVFIITIYKVTLYTNSYIVSKKTSTITTRSGAQKQSVKDDGMLIRMYMHTHTRADIMRHTYIHTHACLHTHTYACTHTQITDMHIHTHTNTHTYFLAIWWFASRTCMCLY